MILVRKNAFLPGNAAPFALLTADYFPWGALCCGGRFRPSAATRLARGASNDATRSPGARCGTGGSRGWEGLEERLRHGMVPASPAGGGTCLHKASLRRSRRSRERFRCPPGKAEEAQDLHWTECGMRYFLGSPRPVRAKRSTRTVQRNSVEPSTSPQGNESHFTRHTRSRCSHSRGLRKACRQG